MIINDTGYKMFNEKIKKMLLSVISFQDGQKCDPNSVRKDEYAYRYFKVVIFV